MCSEQNPQELNSPDDTAGMVLIPAGTFLMGSDKYADERPVHEVFLDAFHIDVFPVTNGQYKEFCDAEGIEYPQDPGFPDLPNYFHECPDYPVVMVTWMDAFIYAKLNGKKLPTEAQWEKAARGGVEQKFWPWGDDFDPALCNSIEIGIGHPTLKGKFPTNGYGIYDMAGNVIEWCNDWFDANYYSISPEKNPAGLDNSSHRSYRGGSWYSNADSTRCAYRNRNYPRLFANYLGFRCVK